MNGILQLSIAGGFAVAAAGLNWIYLASQTTPNEYVALRTGLERGQLIDESDLVAVPIPGQTDRLKRTLIPYPNRSVLFGGRTTREYEAGDVVLTRDLIEPSDLQEWEVIGPFELISVAQRFKQETTGRNEASTSIGRNTVTIAVDADFDTDTSRLLAAITVNQISGDRRTTGSARPASPIVAVQVVPSMKSRLLSAPENLIPPYRNSSASNAESSPVKPRDNVVYQTVSLEGIANVPAVLLEGEFIRFVVPRSAGY